MICLPHLSREEDILAYQPALYFSSPLKARGSTSPLRTRGRGQGHLLPFSGACYHPWELRGGYL